MKQENQKDLNNIANNQHNKKTNNGVQNTTKKRSACSVDDSPMKLEPPNFDHVVVILLIVLITYSSCQQVRFLVYFNLSNI